MILISPNLFFIQFVNTSEHTVYEALTLMPSIKESIILPIHPLFQHYKTVTFTISAFQDNTLISCSNTHVKLEHRGVESHQQLEETKLTECHTYNDLISVNTCYMIAAAQHKHI